MFLYLFFFFFAGVVVGHDSIICNESQCITCHHCNNMYCPPRTKLTCYQIVKRGGGGDNGAHSSSNCACQPEDYCDGFYSCHNWPCPDSGLIPRCNMRNHTCICVHQTRTCSGSDVSTCKITCNSQEKLYCDHGFCSCKSLNYCNQNDADCANHSCSADLGESPFCNVTRCQCAVVVDTCQGSDTSTCRHLNCNGQFMHQICNNGVCQCQLNPSCSSAVECTETNTAMQIGTITLECKSQYGLYTDCKNGRCQCFQNSSSTTATTTTFTVPTTTANTTRSTTLQKHTTTITSTKPQQTTTRDIIIQQQTSSATTGPSTPAKVLAATQPTPNAPIDPNAATCSSRMDCNQQNTHATFLTFAMPCPVAHIDCVNNKCFCSRDKVTTTNRAAGTTSTSLRVTTTASPVVSTTYSLHTRLICPKCDANLTCKWNQSCYPGEVCMLRQYHMDPFTVHCSEKQDCLFMKRNMNVTEILCCEDHQCITDNLP
ncbi:mucin-5AC-like [Crassostrea angulata]|uniref:mucin-5AC-like n=1 Tax=Magallana angulata TaxID=2784310 RepID=UPI0022B1D39E|nr:mucin-5AC-like [Crassostrea angulata]